jgi:hypothetical protein
MARTERLHQACRSTEVGGSAPAFGGSASSLPLWLNAITPANSPHAWGERPQACRADALLLDSVGWTPTPSAIHPAAVAAVADDQPKNRLHFVNPFGCPRGHRLFGWSSAPRGAARRRPSSALLGQLDCASLRSLLSVPWGHSATYGLGAFGLGASGLGASSGQPALEIAQSVLGTRLTSRGSAPSRIAFQRCFVL